MKLCVQFYDPSLRRDARGNVQCFKILGLHKKNDCCAAEPSLFLLYLTLLSIYKTFVMECYESTNSGRCYSLVYATFITNRNQA